MANICSYVFSCNKFWMWSRRFFLQVHIILHCSFMWISPKMRQFQIYIRVSNTLMYFVYIHRNHSDTVSLIYTISFTKIQYVKFRIITKAPGQFFLLLWYWWSLEKESLRLCKRFLYNHDSKWNTEKKKLYVGMLMKGCSKNTRYSKKKSTAGNWK